MQKSKEIQGYFQVPTSNWEFSLTARENVLVHKLQTRPLHGVRFVHFDPSAFVLKFVGGGYFWFNLEPKFIGL